MQLTRQYCSLWTRFNDLFRGNLRRGCKMPKKGGKMTRAQKEAADDEHRPPGLTLSNFIVIPQKQQASACTGNVDKGEDFPALTGNLGNTSTDNGALSSSDCGAAEAPSVVQNVKQEPSFKIKRTKKGNLPITYESRAKGKKVTVISNVSGDLGALLSMLKKATGTGGVAKGEMVELQGDHRKFLETYLKKHPCLW